MNTKRCAKCFEIRSSEEFYLDSAAKGGQRPVCKQCDKSASSAWRKLNPEKAAATSAKWWAANPEKHRVYAAKWRKLNPQKNRDTKARWAKNNPDKVKASAARFSKSNHGKYAAYWANWAKAHRPQLNAKDSKRRAAELNATPNWANSADIKKFYDDAKRLTARTGIPHEVDHVVPLKNMIVCGLHVSHNLQTVTRFANRSKCNRRWPDMPDRLAGLSAAR